MVNIEPRDFTPKGEVWILPPGVMDGICLASNILSELAFEKYLKAVLEKHKNGIAIIENVGV